MAKPETLPLINGVLDYRRTITNPFTNEVITAMDGFGVIAAINEGYIGTVPLNEALNSVRLSLAFIQYADKGEQLKQLIQKEYELGRMQKMIDLFVKLSADLIQAVRQGKLSEDAASIRALLDACDLSACIMLRRSFDPSWTNWTKKEKGNL